jgi:HEAT repeat protein
MRRNDSNGLWPSVCLSLLVLLLFLGARGTGQQGESLAVLVREFNGSQYFWQQLEVAQKLVARNDRKVLSQIQPCLNNEDRHLRGNAAFVFAGFGDERGFKVIDDILMDRSSPRPEGQGIPGGGWALAAQIKADRYYAVHLLGLLKNPRPLPVLIPLLKDNEINYKVAWALGEIGDKAAIPALIDALNDPSPDMRVSSIEALDTLDATEALPRLRLLLKDDDRIHTDNLRKVSEAAQSAIARLSAIR